MGVNASAGKYILDVDASVTLRDIADGAETATATETSVSLNLLDAAYWHNNDVPNGMMAVAVHITAAVDTDATETYVLDLVVEDDVALGSPTPVASLTVPSGTTGFVTMLVDSRTIEALHTTFASTDLWMGIRATLAGTAPSITYGAWIAKTHK